jgi:ATP synthase F1 epsilon subunit|tara:strand:+ start:1685 stop:2065 length:381 start_codon:yes stop_codon:yes gene_type:complete
MSENFNVEIVRPDNKILSEEAEEVTLPCYEGQLTILKNHIPFITFLRPGIIEINKKNKIFVEDGTIEFYENNLLILSTTAISIDSLDKNRIKEKVDEAQKQLSKKEINDKQRYILNHKIDTLNSLN